MRVGFCVVILSREPQVVAEGAKPTRIFVGLRIAKWLSVVVLPDDGVIGWSGDGSRRVEVIGIIVEVESANFVNYCSRTFFQRSLTPIRSFPDFSLTRLNATLVGSLVDGSNRSNNSSFVITTCPA